MAEHIVQIADYRGAVWYDPDKYAPDNLVLTFPNSQDYPAGAGGVLPDGVRLKVFNDTASLTPVTLRATGSDTLQDFNDPATNVTDSVIAEPWYRMEYILHGGAWRLASASIAGMNWRGIWAPGTYQPRSVVQDDGWLMISNKVTSDRAAPEESGNPYWVSGLGDAPGWTPGVGSYSSLITGQRYTESAGAFLKQARLWVPVVSAQQAHALWLVLNPTTSPDFVQLIPTFQATETGWHTIGLGQTPIPAGTIFDLVLSTSATGGPTGFNASWDYRRRNGDPDLGEATHQSNGYDLRFNNIDAYAADRRTSLESVRVGGTIQGGGMTWEVLDVDTTDPDFVRYFVTPAVRLGQNGEYNFAFEWYAPAVLDIVYITGHYASNPDVQGFLGESYDPGSPSLNQNAYGVDIEVADATISADWETMAYSG